MEPAFNQPSPTQQGFQGTEAGVFPRFYRAARYMPHLSQEGGIPVTEPADMVEIRQAGEKDTQVEIVNETHKRRWPNHWAAYQQGREQIQSGTPLEMLFPGNPEIVEACKRANVHTIQALIAVPDSAGHVLPFLTDWKKKAGIFLKGTEKGKGFHELEKALAAAEHKNRDLEERLKLLERSMSKEKSE